MSIFDSVKPADYILSGAGALSAGVSDLVKAQQHDADIARQQSEVLRQEARADAQGSEALPGPVNDFYNNLFNKSAQEHGVDATEAAVLGEGIKRIQAGEDPSKVASELRAQLRPAGGKGAAQAPMQSTAPTMPGATPQGAPGPAQQPTQASKPTSFKRKDLPALQGVLPYMKAEEDRQYKEGHDALVEAGRRDRHAARMQLGYDKLTSQEKQALQKIAVQSASIAQRREAALSRYNASMAAVGVASRNAANQEARTAAGVLALKARVLSDAQRSSDNLKGKLAQSRDFLSPEVQKMLVDEDKALADFETSLDAFEQSVNPGLKVEKTITNKVTQPKLPPQPQGQPQEQGQKPKFKPGKTYMIPGKGKFRYEADDTWTKVP